MYRFGDRRKILQPRQRLLCLLSSSFEVHPSVPTGRTLLRVFAHSSQSIKKDGEKIYFNNVRNTAFLHCSGEALHGDEYRKTSVFGIISDGSVSYGHSKAPSTRALTTYIRRTELLICVNRPDRNIAQLQILSSHFTDGAYRVFLIELECILCLSMILKYYRHSTMQ